MYDRPIEKSILEKLFKCETVHEFIQLMLETCLDLIELTLPFKATLF